MDAGVGHTAWARRTKSSRPEGPKAGPKGRQLEVLLKRLSAKWRQNRPHWSDQFGLSHCNRSLWQSAIAFEKQWELVENRKSIPFCTNIHNNGGNFEKQCEFAENRLKNIPLALKFSTDFVSIVNILFAKKSWLSLLWGWTNLGESNFHWEAECDVPVPGIPGTGNF